MVIFTIKGENKQGLYFSDDPLLKYPVKKNKTWTDKNSPSSIWKNTSTNTEVKVKAGTFKNVVVVKTQYLNPWKGYDINYYAPNVGWILYKSYNSKKQEIKLWT